MVPACIRTIFTLCLKIILLTLCTQYMFRTHITHASSHLSLRFIIEICAAYKTTLTITYRFHFWNFLTNLTLIRQAHLATEIVLLLLFHIRIIRSTNLFHHDEVFGQSLYPWNSSA